MPQFRFLPQKWLRRNERKCSLSGQMEVAEKVTVLPPPRPSFMEEFESYWRQAPEKGLFLGLLAGWCLLFEFLGISSFNFETTRPSLFLWMYHAWNAPAMDASHGNLIAPVVALLLWVKRKELAASLAGPWWPALVLLGLALLLHVFGFLAQQPRVSIVALFLGLYALVGLTWGWKAMKATFFPLFLFAFCMPLGTFVEDLTLPLRIFTVKLTAWTCGFLLDVPVKEHGTALYDASGKINFDVAAACSGIRSFVALLAVSTIFAFLTYKSIWRRLGMILLTIPLVVFCNLIRLVAIVLATQAFDQQAGHFVHEWFGFVTYLIAVGCMLAAGHWLREDSSDHPPPA
ncbi:MAG: exosortase/archaeosortase family protein [Limisphaerales bacterium]